MIEPNARTSSSPREGLPERSGGSPERGETDPEVVAHPKRRSFSAEYKARIVREIESCREHGQVGAILRREGLYSSHLTKWREQVRLHGERGLVAKRRGPAPRPKPSAREIALEREKRKLEKRLAKAEAIIAFQKKVHGLLGIPLSNPESEEDD